MLAKFISWKDDLKSFSEETKGEFKIVKNPSMGYGADFITITISYPDNNIVITQNAVTDGVDAGLSFFIFESKIKIGFENVYIYMYDSGLLDRIFGRNKIKSENKIFDEKYSIRSSDRKLALSIFRDIKVHELFLKNPLLVFNVSTMKGITHVVMKDMETKLYTREELINYLDDFRYIVKKILNFS